jgi:hypothetical protein
MMEHLGQLAAEAETEEEAADVEGGRCRLRGEAGARKEWSPHWSGELWDHSSACG